MIKTTNYGKHTLAFSAKYACECGHKFYRKNTDWFTMNPFNNLSYEENVLKMNQKLKNQKRECPKCKTKLIPTNK